MKKVMIFLMLVMSISLISSYSVFPRPNVNNEFFPNQSFTFNFSFIDDSGNYLYSNQSDLTTDSSGIAFSLLDISSLSQTPTKLLHYRNGTLILNQSFNDEIFKNLYIKNLTLDYANGINISNFDNVYLNLSGGNANQDINITPYYIYAGRLYASSSAYIGVIPNAIAIAPPVIDSSIGYIQFGELDKLNGTGELEFGKLTIDSIAIDGYKYTSDQSVHNFDDDNITTTGTIISTEARFGDEITIGTSIDGDGAQTNFWNGNFQLEDDTINSRINLLSNYGEMGFGTIGGIPAVTTVDLLGGNWDYNGHILTNAQLHTDSDSRYIKWGGSDDVSTRFDGADFNLTQEVGATNFNINNFQNVSIPGTFITQDANSYFTFCPIQDNIATSSGACLEIDLDANGNVAFGIKGTTIKQIVWLNPFRLADNVILYQGSGNDIFKYWYTGGDDHYVTGIGTQATGSSMNWLFLEKSDITNANRLPTNSSNPTFWVYSDDNTNPNDWIRFYHNQTYGVIGVGDGELLFNQSILVWGNATFEENTNQTKGNSTINLPYGEMYYHNHTATPVDFVVDGTYYDLWFTEADQLNGFTFTGGFNASSNLTAQIAGTYKACYFATGDGQNNHVYFTTIEINGVVEDRCESHKKMSAGGDVVTMNGCCLIDLSVGDTINVATADVGATGSSNYYSGNLNLNWVGNL